MSLAVVGHNNAPGPIELAGDAMRDLSAWMAEHPTIASEDDARDAKRLLDRAKSSVGELEAERDGLVRPLNEEIATINSRYKALHNTDSKRPGTFDKIINELKNRLAAFMLAEESKRAAVAEAARMAAWDAERAAREAEEAERIAIENAKAGELGVDVTQVVVEADSRFAAFEKAEREAVRADRDAHVRVGGGWKRSASLRTVETLSVVNAVEAIKEIGLTEKISEAILSGAREFRKDNGRLPAGIETQTTRKL